MLPAEYIGFIINITDTNELNDLLEKVKNILSIMLKSPTEFHYADKLPQHISLRSPGAGKLFITPINNEQLKLVLTVSKTAVGPTDEQTVYGFFTSNFNENALTNTIYEFLQFLAELITIQVTKIELNKALLQQRQSLDTILESLNIGILVTDSKLVTKKYNQNFLIMFDIDQDINDKSLDNFLQQNILNHFLELKQELDNNNFAFEKVFDFSFSSGRPVKYAISISIFTHETIKNYIFVARDLSYTKEIERLKSLDIQKNTFLAHVTHELKTPLTAIMGYLELLIDTEIDEQKKEFLKNIYSESESMLQLVQNLLTITKIETGNLKLKISQFDLIQIITKVIELFKSSKSHNFELIAPQYEITLAADKDKIKEIFLNLISNAVKYSPNGGKITVSVEHDVLNQCVKVDVHDEGIGIPEELIPYIFEKFYRVENPLTARIQGTGLGLYIVKSLIELHKGKISLKSEKSKGTTFTVTLPLKKP